MNICFFYCFYHFSFPSIPLDFYKQIFFLFSFLPQDLAYMLSMWFSRVWSAHHLPWHHTWLVVVKPRWLRWVQRAGKSSIKPEERDHFTGDEALNNAAKNPAIVLLILWKKVVWDNEGNKGRERRWFPTVPWQYLRVTSQLHLRWAALPFPWLPGTSGKFPLTKLMQGGHLLVVD